MSQDDGSQTDSPGLWLRDLRKLLLLHRELGIDNYPRTPELAKFLALPDPQPAPMAPAPAKDQSRPTPPAGKEPPRPGSATPAPTLATIAQELGDCQRCGLNASRTRIVFGSGSPTARLLVVGDFPSPEDDAAGQPFQGGSGELLTRMLQAIGLSREEVYLTSTVKCRPGAGESPQPEHIATCLPFLRQQIAALSPTVICAMGALASQSLLRCTTPLLTLRGRFRDCQGIPLMPTFPPDFLLKNPEMKKAAWLDLQAIQARLKG